LLLPGIQTELSSSAKTTPSKRSIVVSLTVRADPPRCVRFAGEPQTTSVLSVRPVLSVEATAGVNKTDAITVTSKKIEEPVIDSAVFFMACPFNK